MTRKYLSSLVGSMKKWYCYVLVASLCMLLVLSYGVTRSTIKKVSTVTPIINGTNPLEWVRSTLPLAAQKSKDEPLPVLSISAIAPNLSTSINLSVEELRPLQTWKLSRLLINHVQAFSNGIEAVKEAGHAWNALMASIEREKLGHANGSLVKKSKNKQCPHYLSNLDMTKLPSNDFRLHLPCGLVQDSFITIIGIPDDLLGDFRIELTGEALSEDLDPPIILHYNVRFHGDKVTEEPVIVQNTWTTEHNWGQEVRCPSPDPAEDKKVDELDQCNKLVGNASRVRRTSNQINGTRSSSTVLEHVKMTRYFPFKQGRLSVATLRVGMEGFHMTVDGKHVSSFPFRGTLEPWLVNEVRISGNLKTTSIVASALPTTDESEHSFDIKPLKATRLSLSKKPYLFIGVFSTASNFKRRMALRRTWMQYEAMKTGTVAVRFFVGLHKNQLVNEELWNEAGTYGDIQLMPFIDYYSLITLKTLAICIFGVEVASANYIMKTDDDAFVRVDEILNSLKRINTKTGLLYGLINSDSQPHRNPEDKWYISEEEWPEDNYPPWAHGPGYVISNDIAKAIHKKLKAGSLKMFKLEDVAMGIWLSRLKEEGLKVRYESDDRINVDGCNDGYVIAHYQGHRDILCLWQKIQAGDTESCCEER